MPSEGQEEKGEIEAESLGTKQKMRQDGFREVVLTEVKVKPKTGLNAEITCICWRHSPKEIPITFEQISTMMRPAC